MEFVKRTFKLVPECDKNAFLEKCRSGFDAVETSDITNDSTPNL